MLMHELIDREDPRCLYCQSEVDIKSDCSFYHAGSTYNVDLFSCRECKEQFEIHWIEDEDPIAFTFTCKELVVYNQYDFFFIGKKDLLSVNCMNSRSYNSISYFPFEVEFSNKDALYQKLKVLILFS